MLKKQHIICIIISIFLMASLVAAQSQQPSPGTRGMGGQEKPQSSKEKNKPYNNKLGIDQTPHVVKIAPSLNALMEAAQAKKEKEEQTAANRRSEIITYIIALATGIQAIALILTVIVMIRTTRRQLRAYIFMDTMDVLNVAENPPPPAPGQAPPQVGPWIYRPDIGPAAIMVINNSGQTPAYDVIHYANICIREYPLSSDFPPQIFIPTATRLAMPPGGKTQKFINMQQPLTDEEIGQLRAGTHAIYVYGNITYKDIFKKKRFTNFRFFHNGFIGTIGQVTLMTGCEEGNEAN